jgi:phospholipase/carboxylesterase
MDETRLRTHSVTNLTYRVSRPEQPRPPSFLLFHGLGGDENSMWVFAHALPKTSAILAIRGPVPWEAGGFGWVPLTLADGTELGHFQDAGWSVRALVDDLSRERMIDGDSLALVGFSQGAALSFALAASGILRPVGIIALAAFLPLGSLDELSQLRVFWSHGEKDELVPIARARADAQRLERAGAALTYCETHAGHKVGIECLRLLRPWLAALSRSGADSST